jgi:streptogramin lyase
MSRRTVRGRSAKRSRRWARLTLEQLEDRCLLSGITEFTAGITAGATPTGIVRGADGNFWFTEFGSDRIGRTTPAGVVTEFTLPAGSGPLNIVAGPDGDLYFTERSTDKIGRLNPLAGSNSAIQSSFTDSFATGITAGSGPTSIAVGPDGNLWFTEFNTDSVARLTLATGAVNEFVVPGAGSGPAGITAGPDGALWFTEAGSGEIGRITTAGTVTNEFVVPVSGGGVSDPESIVAVPGGDLYFTDFGRDRVLHINTAGQFTQFILPANSGPQGIVFGPDGNLYFTEAVTDRIGRLSPSAFLPGSPISGSPPLVEFSVGITSGASPLGITTSPNGEVWFTENGRNAIGKLVPLSQISVAATGSTVEVYDDHLQLLRQFSPFPGFQGPVSVAVGDINGDGVPDIIVGAGAGAGPHVKVFEGSDGSLLASFFAFAPGYLGGISVASADVNNDGKADVIVGAGAGSSHVKVIDGTKLVQVLANGQIADSALLASFFAFAPGFSGGVSVAAGDVNGDGKADVIVGAGPGAGPHVKVIDATKLGQVPANGQIADSALLASFFAFAPNFPGGIFVAVGDVNGDGVRDLIVGAGASAGPHVKVIDGKKRNQVQANGQITDSALLASFFAFAPNFSGGVRVAADDINGDGRADLIVGAGPGAGPHVKVIDATKLGQVLANGQIADPALLASFFATAASFSGGVFVAADRLDGPLFGPPGITISNMRRNINDVFAFQSPANPSNSVLILDVSPFSTATTPNTFDESAAYELRVANRVLPTAANGGAVSDDLTFRVTFGPPDISGVQDVTLRGLSGGPISRHRRHPGQGQDGSEPRRAGRRRLRRDVPRRRTRRPVP